MSTLSGRLARCKVHQTVMGARRVGWRSGIEGEMQAKLANKATAGRSHFVSTQLGRLHLVEVGRGPETIVLWPSIFTDHHIYAGLVPHLAKQFRFLLIDGPGHGASEGPSQEFSMAECGSAIGAVLDHFGLEQAIVGGTSWGGLAAAELALADPARVAAVLLLNTPFELGRGAPSLSRRMITLGARWLLPTQIFRNGVAASFFSAKSLADNPGYAERFHAMLQTAQPRPLAAAVRSVLLRSQPLRDRLSALTMPVLIIAGLDDSMYPLDAQATAAALVPHGRFAPVAGKHVSVVERPAEVASLIARFLRAEVSPRRSCLAP